MAFTEQDAHDEIAVSGPNDPFPGTYAPQHVRDAWAQAQASVDPTPAELAKYTKGAAPHPMATPAGTAPDPIQAAQVPPPAQTTPSYLDGVLSFADKYKSRVSDIFERVTAANPMGRPMRDLASGAVKGAVNIADSAKSLLTAGPKVSETVNDQGGLVATEDKDPGPDPFHPVYDAARSAILGMRDAIAVKDPSIGDNLISGFGQFAGPFAMYSRVLGAFGTGAELAGGGEAAISSFGAKAAEKASGLAKFAAADAATNATANAPHDPRIADLLSLHNNTESKFGDMLNAVSPDGSLQRHYLDYIASPDVSEADGRFKNVLDGFNIAGALGGVLHAGAGTLRAGWGALHYMADQNMGSMGDLMPANQEGKIAFHGTPSAPFAAFSDDAIGSGQGAQSYGHGHYIAESADTGETYQKSLSGKMNTSAALSDAQSAVKTAGGDKVKAVKNLTDMLANETDTTLRQRMQNSVRLIKSGNADAGKGSLLRVEIDDKHIDNMLDLDKPMSKQPEILNKIPMKDQQKLQQVLEDHGQDLELNELTGNEFRQLLERAHSEDYMPLQDGDDGSHAPRSASQYLSSHGIPGNKYFDSKSRVTGEGTRNYVVFDGKHIKVLGQEK